jgi:glycosyltransferase involved in cell wall biosynthesis
MEQKNPGKYKLMVISSAGAHVRNFIELVRDATSAIHLISVAEPDFEWQNSDLTLVDFSLRSPKNYIKTVSQIRAAYETFRPDVVHVHQLNAVAFFALHALGKYAIPTVATAWGSDVLVQPERNALFRWLVRFSLKRAKVFTSDSVFMGERMQELLPERALDITICNFGVDPVKHVLPKEKIIFSNRLHKKLYRIDKIISAFHSFCQTSEANGWNLVIGATGSETENLKSLATDLGLNDRIKFVGWLQKNENMEYYARAQVFVSVPESDATAISLLEAMNHGCFPIVSDLPVSPEWIDDGRNGRIVKDIDSNFFAGIGDSDFDKVSVINKDIISRKGTKEMASQIFVGLHKKLISGL